MSFHSVLLLDISFVGYLLVGYRSVVLLIPSTVNSYRCETHGHVPFDGGEDCIVVADTRFAYTHEFLVAYLSTALRSSFSVTGFIDAHSARWRAGVAESDVPRPTATSVYNALERFTELTDLCAMPGATGCLRCGPDPDIVLCDATSATIAMTAEQKSGFDLDGVTPGSLTVPTLSTVEYVFLSFLLYFAVRLRSRRFCV